ncbi:MAG: ABC transporter ATP-binding protein [candidate division KSB1 bacterium]|nr:ABC transporter ATP-binding protein [candidate division KSB1 bacterium]
MNLYKRVFSYLFPYWKHMLLALLLTLVYVTSNYASYWISASFIKELFNPTKVESVEPKSSDETGLTENVTDNVFKSEKGDLEKRINDWIKSVLVAPDRERTLINICFVIFMAFFVKNLSAYLRRITIFYIQLNIVIRLRQQIHETLMRLPLLFLGTRHTGKYTSVAFNDVNALQQVLKDSFIKLINHPIQLIVNIVLLFMISWRLTLISILIVPVSAFIIVKIGQSLRRKSRRVFRQISVVMSAFQESVSAVRIVKAFTSESKEQGRFESANHKYFKKEFRAKRLNFLTSPLNETLGVGIFVVLLWYGGNQVYAGTGLSAESFLRYLVMMFALFQPLREFSGLNNKLQTGMAAAERIFELIDSPKEVYDKPKAKRLNRFKQSIELKHVTFAYEPGHTVLRDIHLTINKGEMVAFVGHSGAGKSTLVDLIPRFYEIEFGEILVDGINVKEYTLNSLRDKIGMVSQETVLFNDTVRMNIGYGVNSYTDKDIIAAAKHANAWEFIKDLEHRLDTVIGERGSNLSGGQRQRLSIARAIMKNTPIMILDEATSALDTQSEKLVQSAIDNLMKNRTVLAIAHRLSTVIHADKIVVMDQGRIVAMGKHEELLKQSPVYQNLYEMQFNNEPGS